MTRVLILGGNGLLGPHVVRELERDYQLVVSDIAPIETNHESIVVDLADWDQVRAAAAGCDAIVNCSVMRPDRTLAFDVNTRGTWNAVRASPPSCCTGRIFPKTPNNGQIERRRVAAEQS